MSEELLVKRVNDVDNSNKTTITTTATTTATSITITNNDDDAKVNVVEHVATEVARTNSLLTNDETRKTSIDVADLEYDEDYNSLIADKEIEEFENEIDPFEDAFGGSNLNAENFIKADENRRIGNGSFTPDNLIDEDFEAELSNQTTTNDVEDEKEKRRKEIREKIDQYGIVTVCGSDHSARPVIIFAACNLPNKAEIEKQSYFFKDQNDFYELLLEVLMAILDGYVESDYTLVYLHHGLRSDNKPSLPWLLRAYRVLDRKYKKNLKALFIVYPSYFIKLVWQLFKPFISTKFSKKVFYCSNLDGLEQYMDIKSMPIPEAVKKYDLTLNTSRNKQTPAQNLYLKTQMFGVPLKHIIDSNNGERIPRVVSDTIEFMKQIGLQEEGLFRKSGSAERIKYLRKVYDEGQIVKFENEDLHVAAALLKLFFRELKEPLLTFNLYNEILTLQGTLEISDKVDVMRDLITEKLPNENYVVLKYLIEFLSEISKNSTINKMNDKNLSIIFGPNLLWSPTTNVNEHSLTTISCINSFVELLIRFNQDIFTK